MADWNSDNITLRSKEIHRRSHEFGTDVTNEGADEDVTDAEDDDAVGTDDVVVVDEVGTVDVVDVVVDEVGTVDVVDVVVDEVGPVELVVDVVVVDEVGPVELVVDVVVVDEVGTLVLSVPPTDFERLAESDTLFEPTADDDAELEELDDEAKTVDATSAASEPKTDESDELLTDQFNSAESVSEARCD